jgi:uncharacterized protein YrrD
MLVLGSRFHHTPIMSLQTGTKLAETSKALIDPRNLTVAAYEVEGPLLNVRPAYLRMNEVREVSSIGMIVDSNDDIIALDDVIAIKTLVDMQFNLIGLSVIDELKHKLGKVEDYTLETRDFVIQQLHVKRGLLKGINDTGLLIGRSQIIEINDSEVIVKATAKKIAHPVETASRNDYINPFRQPSPRPETVDLP